MEDATSAKSQAGQSTRHAFKVLRLLSKATDVMSITEISKALNMHQSIVHRACVTLEATNFIERIAHSAKFAVGHQGSYLLASFLERFPIRQLSIPFLRRIVLETEQSAELFIRVGWYSVRLVLVEPSRQDLPFKRLGESHLLHRTPEGQVLLQGLGEDALSAYSVFAASQGQLVSPEALKAILNSLDLPDLFAIDKAEPGETAMASLKTIEETLCAVLSISAPETGHDCDLTKIRFEVSQLQELTREQLSDYSEDALSLAPKDDIVLPDG